MSAAGDRQLPQFTLDGYAALLDGLLANGYVSRPVEDLAQPRTSERELFVRHDIDLHITGIELMAAIETRSGVTATYYVPLTLPFNPLYPPNERILRGIVSRGHRIGLHYDLSAYPQDPDEARGRLDLEASVLGVVTGEAPRTICMHNPSLQGRDLFREVDGYLNPHDPRRGADLAYVSDSCRRWRDGQVLECLRGGAPPRLLLNTHPELWLGTPAEASRESFLEGTLLANALEQPRSYILDDVRSAWERHGEILASERTAP